MLFLLPSTKCKFQEFPPVIVVEFRQKAPSGVYVRQSEDRLSEPQFQRSMALSGVPVLAQDYVGAGIVPTPQPRYKIKVDAEHSARMSDPAGLLL